MPGSSSDRPAVERVHPPNAVIRIANPVVRRVLTSPLHPLVSNALLLLRYRGRRSGRALALPVARQHLDGQTVVFTNSRWRHNFRGGHDAELVDRGVVRAVAGTLIEDPEAIADVYAKRIGELGWKTAQRPLGIRVNAKRPPTREELLDAIGRSGLSVVTFTPRAAG